MSPPSLRRTAAVVAIGALGTIGVALPPYGRAASFVARAAALTGWPAALAEWSSQPVVIHELTTPTRYGTIRALLYRPAAPRRTAVLVAGIHPAGINEPRLVALAEDLAATGVAVLTPEIPDMARFRITPHATDVIEDVTAWLAAQGELAPDGRVGLMGISFSGGLSVVAGGRPAVRNRVAYVFALGGHGDLERVLRFLCTGIESDGSKRRPHDYGLAVLLMTLAERLVPDSQLGQLERGIQTFLMASALDAANDPGAKQRFDEARDIARELPEPAATLLSLVNDRDVVRLGPLLLPEIASLSSSPSLSPERVEPPAAPVFLLHGTDDNVVPAAESTLLGKHLEQRSVTTRVLLSPLITHAEIERAPGPEETWQLIAFWKDLLVQ